MGEERESHWMPTFANQPPRRNYPAVSAPGASKARSSSPSAISPTSSDDEGSSSGGITNRCSPKAVHNIVSKFSEFKKELVRQIGFGGLLEVPCISKVNLKLSSWLLSRLDTDESCLVFSESRRIYVHEKDIGIVFGIPCGDIDVSSAEISPEQLDGIRNTCGLCGKDSLSFKSLEYVLQKHIDDRSSRLELDRFKISFVIFVMGHLLAPSANHNHGNCDFWAALKDTEMIYRFNWCRYMYSYVMEAA